MQRFSCLIVALFLIFPIHLVGQEIEVQEVQEKMSQGNKNGLTVNIPEASVDKVEDDWDKWLRKELNGNTSTNSGEIVGEECENDDISDLPFVVYSKVEEKDKGTRLTVFVNLGGAYLNSNEHGDRFEVMKEQLTSFSKEVATEALEEKLGDAEDKLDDLTDKRDNYVKEKEDLQSDVEDYKEEIEDCKETIEEAKKNIEKNERKIKKYKKKKEDQQEKVENQKEKLEKIEERLKNVD